jgi:hypothetical protein
MRFALDAGDLNDRLAEVELGMTRRVAEGNEDLQLHFLRPSYGGTDLRGASGVSVFVSQAFEDPLGGVSLLGRCGLVRFQDLVDDTENLPS